MAGAAIFGITGRMGHALVQCLAGEGFPGLTLSGAVAAPGHARLGGDAAADGPPTGVLITAEPASGLLRAAVAIDFSRPECVAEHAQCCVAAKVPLLVGTTGLDAATRAELTAAASAIPVLIAPNTSIGVGVLARLARLAALALGDDYDVEITEAHHRLKRDAPSGTALALGEVVAKARGADFAASAVFDRHGVDAVRRAGSIGFSVVRAADIVGEHTVMFAAAGERIELTHRATDRAVFARGALRAARWLAGRPAGLYVMDDVLAA